MLWISKFLLFSMKTVVLKSQIQLVINRKSDILEI